MSDGSERGRQIGLAAGVGLVLLGAWFLLRSTGLVPDAALEIWRRVSGPAALIVLGIVVVSVASRGGFAFRGPVAGSRLYKSRTDKWVDGVLGGLGQYLGIDPVLLRLAFIVLVLAGWGGLVIAYIVMAVIVPREPEQSTTGPGQIPRAPEQPGPTPS